MSTSARVSLTSRAQNGQVGLGPWGCYIGGDCNRVVEEGRGGGVSPRVKKPVVEGMRCCEEEAGGLGEVRARSMERKRDSGMRRSVFSDRKREAKTNGVESCAE